MGPREDKIPINRQWVPILFIIGQDYHNTYNTTWIPGFLVQFNAYFGQLKRIFSHFHDENMWAVAQNNKYK